MKRKVTNYFLIGIISLLLLPSFLKASVVIPDNTKKVVGGKTYTSVYGSYEPGRETDYNYIYGLISPKKMVISIFENEGLSNNYFILENGVYHDTEATATEVIDSRSNMWNEDTSEYRIKQYEDEEGNKKFGVFYTNYFVITDEHNQCYVDNLDEIALDGTQYYFLNNDNYELVSEFNSEEAHEYYVKVDCEKHANILVKELTTEQTELLSIIMNELELEYAEVNPRLYTYAIPIKDDYLFAFEITYYNEDDNEEYEHRIYDFSGNIVDKFDGAKNFAYLKESGLYLFQTETEFIVYDTEFNIVYSELISNLPVTSETDIYGFDFDKNTAYFDFENGLYMVLTRYVVEEGDNQRFTDKDLTVKFNGDLDLLDKVYVNDNVLDSKNYTKTKGSTIITLSKDYLSSLNAGTYTLKASYTDGGEATSTFIINNALVNPSTGDNVVSTVILGGISLIGLLGIGLYLKKRNI